MILCRECYNLIADEDYSLVRSLPYEQTCDCCKKYRSGTEINGDKKELFKLIEERRNK
jgi:hypothetical protein